MWKVFSDQFTVGVPLRFFLNLEGIWEVGSFQLSVAVYSGQFRFRHPEGGTTEGSQ